MTTTTTEAAGELEQIVQYLEHLLCRAKRVAVSRSFQQSWSEWRAGVASSSAQLLKDDHRLDGSIFVRSASLARR